MNMKKTIVKPICLNCWKLPDCQHSMTNGFCAEFQEKKPKRDPADNPAENWSKGNDLN